ncbi:MAG: hypothetical protein QXL24_03825, partial [Candidatus Jordarchaeaceae archaeon]
WQFEDGLIYVKIPSEDGKSEEKEFILNPFTGNIELIKGELKIGKSKSPPQFKPERIFFFELGGDELAKAKPETKPAAPKKPKK